MTQDADESSTEPSGLDSAGGMFGTAAGNNGEPVPELTILPCSNVNGRPNDVSLNDVSTYKDVDVSTYKDVVSLNDVS